MKLRDLFDFTLLAALWGASFLFMRVAAPAFGPLAIADLRTAIAALVLLSLLVWRGGIAELAPNALRFLLLGAFNSAIPFTLFAYAALSITAGLASILNATVPLFAALVAWVWLRDKLTVAAMDRAGDRVRRRAVAIGRSSAASSRAEKDGPSLPGLVASLSYGISGNLAKRHFAHIRPLAVATGSQIAATVLLLPLTLLYLPPSDAERA